VQTQNGQQMKMTHHRTYLRIQLEENEEENTRKYSGPTGLSSVLPTAVTGPAETR
jgi:hypothetical protein